MEEKVKQISEIKEMRKQIDKEITDVEKRLGNEIRLVNMQLNQLLPIFEVVHDMSDKNIFSAIQGVYIEAGWIKEILNIFMRRSMRSILGRSMRVLMKGFHGMNSMIRLMSIESCATWLRLRTGLRIFDLLLMIDIIM